VERYNSLTGNKISSSMPNRPSKKEIMRSENEVQWFVRTQTTGLMR